MYLLCLILAGIVSILYLYLVKTYNHWHKKGVIHLKPELFFGTIRDVALFKTTMAESFQKMYNEFEGLPFVGFYELQTPSLLLRDPKLVKQFFVKDFNHFHDRGFVFNENADPLSAHLVNLSGERWRALRIKLTPVFTTNKIREVFGPIMKISDRFSNFVRQYAESEDTVEMRELAAKFTTEVISTCCFGLETNSIQHADSEFRTMCKQVSSPSLTLSIKRFIRLYMPSIYKSFAMTHNTPEVSKYFLRIVKEIIDYREKNNVVRADFMQTLLKIMNVDAGKGATKLENQSAQSNQEGDQQNVGTSYAVIDENTIAAQAFVFFIAGFETSSTAISFAMYELAANPDIQDKLYNEIRDVLEKFGCASYEAISEMDYLDRVVNETLRKHPPAPVNARVCTQDYIIPGTDITIEKGNRIAVPVYAIHHDPKYYPNPSKFDPDRFLEENKKLRENGTFLPFGDGPRICIGLKFAYAQMKAGLVAVLRDYEIALSPKTILPLEYDPKSFLLGTKSGIWLKIRHREKTLN